MATCLTTLPPAPPPKLNPSTNPNNPRTVNPQPAHPVEPLDPSGQLQRQLPRVAVRVAAHAAVARRLHGHALCDLAGDDVEVRVGGDAWGWG